MKHTAPPDNFTCVTELDERIVEAQHKFDTDEAFWVADFNRVRHSIHLWDAHLSDIKPHYAVKCCNEPQLIQFLADRGYGFDCASKTELEVVLNIGVDANRIVFSHPIKSIEAIKFAKENNVERLVYDTEEELRKILRYYPDAELFLRIKPKFSNAKIQLSKKFGAAPEDVPELLALTAELGGNFIGFSFHVGSLCDDITTFRTALQYVAELKEITEKLGLSCHFVDIGGGFLPPNAPANNSFGEVADAIKSAIDEYFDGDEIEFVAEPGRFISSEFMDLVLPVTSVKIHVDESGQKSQSIFVPDGIYGSFNAIIYDHAEPHFEIHTESIGDKLPTTLWGQTCDPSDIIYEDMMWPQLEIGDILTVKRFSAYTYSPTSFFNGFPHHPVHIINYDDDE